MGQTGNFFLGGGGCFKYFQGSKNLRKNILSITEKSYGIGTFNEVSIYIIKKAFLCLMVVKKVKFYALN
jgi:hypothetical protein